MSLGARLVFTTLLLSLLPRGTLAQAAPSPSAASPSPPAGVYVNGFGALMQLSSEQRYHRVSPPLGGLTVGLSAAVGKFVNADNALEGEVAFYGISKSQSFNYNWTEEYTAGHRDLIFNLLLRSRFSRHVEFVAGGGMAKTMTYERSKISRPNGGTNPFPPTPLPDREHHGGGLTVTTGLDGVIPAGRRVSIVPSFRFRWLERPEGSLTWTDGVGNYIFQFGVGVRFE